MGKGFLNRGSDVMAETRKWEENLDPIAAFYLDVSSPNWPFSA